MERDVGDILDRAGIAYLKSERIGEPESRREWHAFERALQNTIRRYPRLPLEDFYKTLLSIHAMIWDLEADLRQGKLDEMLYEVGRRAIAIRELNSLRVQLKNIVNKLTETGYQDIKRDHLSQF